MNRLTMDYLKNQEDTVTGLLWFLYFMSFFICFLIGVSVGLMFQLNN
jgi:hypothetical protein